MARAREREIGKRKEIFHGLFSYPAVCTRGGRKITKARDESALPPFLWEVGPIMNIWYGESITKKVV